LQLNGRQYIKLELIGRGGSSKVFKVLGPDGKLYALKKVNFKGVDPTAVAGYVNEMTLLRKLSNCERIIKLHDSELNREAGHLLMVHAPITGH
jgi:serine/threonine-protein kinase TTK/MPS1